MKKETPARARKEQEGTTGVKVRTAILCLTLLVLPLVRASGPQSASPAEFSFAEFQELFLEATQAHDWEQVILVVRKAFALLEAPEAVEYCRRALTVAQQQEDRWAEAAAWWMLGDAYLRTADYEKGLDSSQQALEIARELDDPRGEGWAAHIIGDIYERRGQYRAAIPPLELSLQRGRETGGRMQEGDALGDLGDIYRSLGDFEKSLEFQRVALRLAREVSDRHGEEWALANLGRTYLQIGQYQEALRWYELSKELAQELGDHAGVARALGDIGDIYVRLGREEDAERAYDQGRQLARENADPHEEGRALTSLAQIQARRQQADAAIATLLQAGGLSRQVGDAENLVFVHIGLGHLYLQQAGDRAGFEQARRAFETATKIARQTDALPLLWIARDGEARALEALGDNATGAAQRRYWQRARRAYEESIEAIETMRFRLRTAPSEFEATFLAAEDKYEVYERLIRLLVKLGETEHALTYLQRARYAALTERLRLADTSTPEPILAELLQGYEDLGRQREAIRALRSEELAKPEQDRPSRTLENLSVVLAQTEAELHQTWAAIEQIDPNLAALVRISPARWVRLQDIIPPGTVVLQYLPLKAQLLIFVQLQNHPPTFVAVDVSRAELEALVVQVREELSAIEAQLELPYASKDFSVAPRLRGALVRLHGYLIDPIEAQLKNARNVAILPYGTLYYLPFAALARPSASGQLTYLVQELPLAYLHELTADGLGALPPPIFQSSSVMAAFGNPDNSLPSAEEEVREIAELLARWHPQVYLGPQASRRAVLELPNETSVVHFATHGVLDQADVNESYLVLADGRLRQREIYGLGLRQRGTRLVVLSACQTFPGSDQPGVEVLGLADAFIKSGASTVLATLWPVESKSTANLMVHFYQVLAGGHPPSKAEALRQAQLALLSNPHYQHPYFWAPFVLYGDWR